MGNGLPTVISLDGEWDIYRRNELREILATADSQRDLVLDLSAVTYADSTVLNELVCMRRDRLAKQLPMPALVPSGMLNRVLTITRMTEFFQCFTTLESALASFEGNNAVCDPSTSVSPPP